MHGSNLILIGRLSLEKGFIFPKTSSLFRLYGKPNLMDLVKPALEDISPEVHRYIKH